MGGNQYSNEDDVISSVDDILDPQDECFFHLWDQSTAIPMEYVGKPQREYVEKRSSFGVIS